ncbi:MAG: HTH domain-containing protein, partial [Candidatus Delongbacteria bacterium]|nr:HTH domain-containing protein [Candidatus Delongbacteria bacterium]MCG2760697.1 HTH domain-containing protein [Candidatus Delongbacteria bacterium]
RLDKKTTQKVGDDAVNVPDDTVNDTVNIAKEPLNDTVNHMNSTVNDTVNDLQRIILNEINIKSEITYDELAERLNKGRMTIYRNVKKLIGLGTLIRIGPDKGGHWVVLKKSGK